MRAVFNSFQGRFSDTPQAIWERLAGRSEHELLWLADPAHAVDFPAGVETISTEDPGAAKVLEAADVLIANSHTELEWDASGTTYLQTWHGTPLKRIHHDVLWAPEGRLARLDRDVDRWDLLLSPNHPSTPRLRKAFGFDGPVVETGYPRNDVLAGAGAVEARRNARQRLGLDEGVTAVLYAPTWRDQ